MRHCEHETFFAKHLDRVPSRVAADPELLLNDLLARQRVKVSQLPVLDPGAQDPGHLLIQGHVGELINHVANVDHLPYVALAAYVGNVWYVGYAVIMDADPDRSLRDIEPAADAQPAVQTSLGTIHQAMLDLSTIATRLADVNAGLVTAGESGYKRLATQLNSLSAELGQAAEWLRDAAASVGR